MWWIWDENISLIEKIIFNLFYHEIIYIIKNYEINGIIFIYIINIISLIFNFHYKISEDRNTMTK